MIGSRIVVDGLRSTDPESLTACFYDGKFIGDRLQVLEVNGTDVGEIVNIDVEDVGHGMHYVTVVLICGELVWRGPPPDPDSPEWEAWSRWQVEGDRKHTENTTSGSEDSRAS